MAEVPLDRGWAWCVLIGCFINTFFVIGGMKSVGILFVQIVEYFDASPALAGWMIGLQYFGLSIFSPVATALGIRYSYRYVVFFGGSVMALGFLLAAFLHNVYAVITVLGLFIGVGNGFLFSPSLIMVGQYFDRYRSSAMGFVMAGGSLGQLAIPVIMRYLLDELSFYGCCVIYAAITLNTSVAAALLRPQSFYLGDEHVLQEESIDLDDDVYEDEEATQCLEKKEDTKEKEGQTNCEERSKTEPVKKDMPRSNSKKFSIDGTRDKFRNSLRITRKPIQETCAVVASPQRRRERRISMVRREKKHVCHELRHTFVTMFHKSVTGKFVFWVYDVAVCFANAGYLSQFILIPSYANEIGITKQEVAWILAISGFIDLIARIVGGIFNNLHIMSTAVIISVSLFITSGTVTICLLFPYFSSLLAHGILLGFFGGMYITLYPVALVEFLGMNLFPKAFALIVMSLGLFFLPLPTLFGEIFDLVGSYLPAMWISVIAMVIGGVLVMFEPLAKRQDDKRTAAHVRKAKQEAETRRV